MDSLPENAPIRDASQPLTVQQYQQLGRQGGVAKNTELIRGVVVEKGIKSPHHSWLVQFLVDWLRANLVDDHHVRQEQPLTFVDSEPEPDVAVVKGGPSLYRKWHPTTATLVIEVAVSSEDADREKASLYAAAGVAEYWIVVPDELSVEVHNEPDGDHYKRRVIYGTSDSIDCGCLTLPPFAVDQLFH